jgi:hypothetical protein
LTEAILAQLALIFGRPAAQPTAFFYQDWAREPFTATEFDQPPMYEHPLYHPPPAKPLFGTALSFLPARKPPCNTAVIWKVPWSLPNARQWRYNFD